MLAVDIKQLSFFPAYSSVFYLIHQQQPVRSEPYSFKKTLPELYQNPNGCHTPRATMQRPMIFSYLCISFSILVRVDK